MKVFQFSLSQSRPPFLHPGKSRRQNFLPQRSAIPGWRTLVSWCRVTADMHTPAQSMARTLSVARQHFLCGKVCVQRNSQANQVFEKILGDTKFYILQHCCICGFTPFIKCCICGFIPFIKLAVKYWLRASSGILVNTNKSFEIRSGSHGIVNSSSWSCHVWTALLHVASLYPCVCMCII